MDFNVDRTLDCKGLSCPMPMLKLAKEMKGMDGGQVLEMVGTDPGSKGDVPGWCEKTGNELLGVEEDAGIFKFFIRKG